MSLIISCFKTVNSASSMQHGDDNSFTEETATKVISNLLTKIFRKEIIRPPTIYDGAIDINVHVQDVEDYLVLATIQSQKEKVSVMLNSLSDDIKSELIMQLGFDDNKTNFEWIKNKLKALYSERISDASPLLSMLHLKQKSGQKHLLHLDQQARQKYMLQTLYNGVRNGSLAKSVKLLKPNTLDEAVDYIKKAKIYTR